ncbi:MAG: uroporphyrinogen decarboxylase family protein [Armatimonadota bacterium]|nr:uroporphyrinogen decarboxylase family protein [Armatimonadota bacterium]
MNARERFQRIFRYEPVDGVPVLALEPYEQAGLERWRREGLPKDQSPEEFLGMDLLRKLPVNLGPIPAFEPKVISETPEYYVETDLFGATVRRRRDAPSMYYGYVDHPVKNLDDWRAYRDRRYDPHSLGRLPADIDTAAAGFNAGEDPVGLEIFPFFFRQGFYLMGMERFMTAFYDSPDLIREMFSFWSEFVIEVIRPFISRVKLDFVSFGEDLAYKGGPHISPQIYREFWLPYQEPIIRELKSAGAPVICMYSAGNLRPLLPTLLDHGFNCAWPLEQGSGMDPIALRAEYGPDLLLAGGVAKEALIAGPKAIDRALERLTPLIEEGGYFPALDDMVPPEVPFDHYRHYVQVLRVLGATIR